jgi:hypothetical protein
VRNALTKDGWLITDDPFCMIYKGTHVYADLAAELPFAAEKEEQEIVVEIKGFRVPSPMTELERALGQYGNYRTFLRKLSPERELFLAVTEDVWQDFFMKQQWRKSSLTINLHSLSSTQFLRKLFNG